MTRFYSSTAQPTTLSAAATDVATTIQVTATTGFPAVEFILALDYGTSQQELVKVTAVAGTTLTVVRGFDSTTAQAHSLGAAVRHVHTADDFRLSRTHEAASSGVHGATGAVVGTTDTQTLTNKTLGSSNTLNGFTASKVAVTDATGKLVAGSSAVPTGTLVGTSDAQTLTNKTVNLTSNTVSGTTAEFNAALSDGDFATLAGSETLTNKDLSSLTNTLPAFVSPVGEVKMFAGSTAPTGYLLCDGTAVSRATYPALFALIGSTYGAGDGTTTFNVPNLKGRVVVGRDAAQVEFDTLGETGGEKTHTLTTAEMPGHTHTTDVHTHGSSVSGTNNFIRYSGTGGNINIAFGGVEAKGESLSVGIGSGGGGSTSSTGSGGAHNNLQPYIALNYIIRAA